MRISDWSSDVCSSDQVRGLGEPGVEPADMVRVHAGVRGVVVDAVVDAERLAQPVGEETRMRHHEPGNAFGQADGPHGATDGELPEPAVEGVHAGNRSEEHTSELQALMPNSSA